MGAGAGGGGGGLHEMWRQFEPLLETFPQIHPSGAQMSEGESEPTKSKAAEHIQNQETLINMSGRSAQHQSARITNQDAILFITLTTETFGTRDP